MRLLLVGYAGHPSMRLRLLQHVPRLEQAGHSVSVCLLERGRRYDSLRVVPELAKKLRSADIVVVQRILLRPINALLRASSVPVVFDFDDALHLVRPPQHVPANRRDAFRRRLMPPYRSLVRGGPFHSSRRRPLHEMSRLAQVVIAGNEWLRDEVAGAANEVVVIPTTIDVRGNRPKVPSDARPLTVGWVGTPANVGVHLPIIDLAFRELAERYGKDLQLTVVSSSPYVTGAIATQFIPWSLSGEAEAVSRFDVGIMPLTDHPFNLGKCAFKAILYMSHGIPVVLSPVGANLSLVEHGLDGLFADEPEEWVTAISALLDDIALRERIGAAGFEKVRRAYSTDRSFPLFESALAIAAGSSP